MAKKAFNGACMAGLAPRGTPDFFGPHTAPGRWSIVAAEQPRGLRLPGNQPQSEINVLLWIGAVSYTSPASRRAAAADEGPARKTATGGWPAVALASDHIACMVQRFLRIT